MDAELPTVRSDWALFLDIDGTLLEIAATPESVTVPAELRANLGALHAAFEGALAIISGRSIATIDRLFAPLVLPAAGQHGAELRNGEETGGLAPPPRLPAILAALEGFALSHPGILVEAKGLSVALHYRLAPEHGIAAWQFARALIAAEGDGIELLPGRMAIDFKPRAADKGSAIEWFLGRAPFQGRVPVFAGDDRTDNDGFAAVNRRGGHSIRVGELGDSAARFGIGSPAALRQWLEACVGERAKEEASRE